MQYFRYSSILYDKRSDLYETGILYVHYRRLGLALLPPCSFMLGFHLVPLSDYTSNAICSESVRINQSWEIH